MVGSSRQSAADLARVLWGAHLNGLLWGLGNGLVGTTLVIYIANELQAPRIGLGIGWLLAAPHFTGLLRFVAPGLIGRIANRKTFCLAMYLISAVLLLALPALLIPGSWTETIGASWGAPLERSRPLAPLVFLVLIWCLYHLFEYLGTVALWSWLGDAVPRRVRGRFLGLRELWMTSGRVGGMLLGALVSFGSSFFFDRNAWPGYLLLNVLGVASFLGAVIPLMWMPHLETLSSRPVPLFSTWNWAPFCDRRFLLFLLFGMWFSTVNGLTQTPQNLYPARVLGFMLGVMLTFRVGMHLGQLALSPSLGRLCDRYGNRPVLIVSLLLVALGPLFFAAATRENPWWLAGAWILWIAYAGMNVGTSNLLLKLALPERNGPYIAANFAVTSLCYAVASLIGGALYDQYHAAAVDLPGIGATNYYQIVFVGGWILRSLGVVWLWFLLEPAGAASTTPRRTANLGPVYSG